MKIELNISTEDPLSLAQQVVATIDAVQAAMQSDIRKREQKLEETKQAQALVNEKARELKVETRLYQIEVGRIAADTTRSTRDLEKALSVLQSLRKPQPTDTDPPAG